MPTLRRRRAGVRMQFVCEAEKRDIFVSAHIVGGELGEGVGGGFFEAREFA